MATTAAERLGIYISAPFCRSKCAYCNFASGVFAGVDRGRYVDRVIEDLRQAGAMAARLGAELPRAVDSIYMGGGTPTLLAPEQLSRIFAAVRAEFDCLPGAEITVECAPAFIAAETLDALLAAGLNRVSLGVQSFVDREAAVSGRLHKRADALEDLRRLRAAGVENISVDLIAGLAGQTAASWEQSLDVLIDCGAPHASVYMLEVDEDSRLGREALAGGDRYHAREIPAEDEIVAMYQRAIERLAAAGLRQYEISNFARPGYESRHNLRYWRRQPYLGVGLDASSMLRLSGGEAVARIKTADEMEAYLASGEPVETERLGRSRQHEEAWFLGLRTNAGVSLPELEAEFGAELVNEARALLGPLAERGLIEIAADSVRLSPRGRLLSNEVFAEFIAPGV
jgi:oxygen-independent coproporphyrinogen-3 oxidase